MSKHAVLLFYALCLVAATALVPEVDYDDPQTVEIIREVGRSVPTGFATP